MNRFKRHAPPLRGSDNERFGLALCGQRLATIVENHGAITCKRCLRCVVAGRAKKGRLCDRNTEKI